MLKQYINVFKLRIGFVIALAALGGMAITPGQSLPIWKVLVLFLTVLMGSAAAGAFNQYSERDIDAKMTRTKNRPFVSGFFQHGLKWLMAIGLILVVAVLSAALVLNAMAALNIFLGAFTYAIVYTVWLKRRTWLNIIFGGLSGSFAVLSRCGSSGSDIRPASRPVGFSVVSVDPSAFLESGDSLSGTICSSRCAYAAGGKRRSESGAYHIRAHHPSGDCFSIAVLLRIELDLSHRRFVWRRLLSDQKCAVGAQSHQTNGDGQFLCIDGTAKHFVIGTDVGSDVRNLTQP